MRRNVGGRNVGRQAAANVGEGVMCRGAVEAAAGVGVDNTLFRTVPRTAQ